MRPLPYVGFIFQLFDHSPSTLSVDQQWFWLLFLNSRTVCNKAFLISDLLNDEAANPVCITETWLDPELFQRCPAGFGMLHQSRNQGKSGGVEIVIQKLLWLSWMLYYKPLNVKSCSLNSALENSWDSYYTSRPAAQHLPGWASQLFFWADNGIPQMYDSVGILPSLGVGSEIAQ